MIMPNGPKQLLLWIAAAVVAIAVLVFILVRERRPGEARHALYLVGDPQRGAALFYGDKQCSICHAVNGEGGRIAPDLSASRPGSPAMGWLATVLWNHAPGMFRRIRSSQAYPQLSTQEMADLLSFLYQAGNADRPGDMSAGAKVFQEKGCVRCHAVRGAGGNAAPDLASVAGESTDEWMSAMWNHAQSMIGPVTTALGEWPKFSGTEMNNLAAYVSGTPKPTSPQQPKGNADRGWTVFQSRCIACHSVRGNGGKTGPELGPERDLPLSASQFASTLWNHAPAMVEAGHDRGIAPTLDKNEMADLLAFMASLRYVEPVGSPFVGQRVFADRGCARCHGNGAEGTQLGPSIRAHGDAYTAVSLTTALWKHGPKMVDMAQEMSIPWPTLQASDIGDLVSFLNGIPGR
jgi:mono/diheme cytochrome c family protein